MMMIDSHWLKYLGRFRNITKIQHKPKTSSCRVSSEEYNELLHQHIKALDYILMLCNDMENLVIKMTDTESKLKQLEGFLMEDEDE